MGLILDSSVLIAAERQGVNAHQALAQIARRLTGQEIGLSVITLMELAHGAARANSPQRSLVRWLFLNELRAALPVYPVTIPIALRAGQLDGENAARGLKVALSDLLIGVTALEAGYGVATSNIRHFQLIPGLDIVAC